ncbi:MAG: hypothetical protein QM831_08690 [Kofleriaceae bacterium]
MAKRFAIGGVIVIAVWLIALLIIGAIVGSRTATTTKQRIAESLHGSASLDDADLALIRGRLEMKHLAVHRDDLVGHLALDVQDVDCELAPLGLALFDRSCHSLAIRGIRLDVSTAALFQLKHPKQNPITADRVTIDDAVFSFSASALLPELGKIIITIDHADAGVTTFKTPLSWLFSLENLRAHIDVANVTVYLTYANGSFGASGSLFGSTPVVVPLQLPVATILDGKAELALLIKTGEDLAEQLVQKRAEDWLRTKL